MSPSGSVPRMARVTVWPSPEPCGAGVGHRRAAGWCRPRPRRRSRRRRGRPGPRPAPRPGRAKPGEASKEMVPEITPVDGSIARPGGRPAADQVRGSPSGSPAGSGSETACALGVALVRRRLREDRGPVGVGHRPGEGVGVEEAVAGPPLAARRRRATRGGVVGDGARDQAGRRVDRQARRQARRRPGEGVAVEVGGRGGQRSPPAPSASARFTRSPSKVGGRLVSTTAQVKVHGVDQAADVLHPHHHRSRASPARPRR